MKAVSIIILVMLVLMVFLSGCSKCNKTCMYLNEEMGESQPQFKQIVGGECRYLPKLTKFNEENPQLVSMTGECKGEDKWCDCKFENGTFMSDSYP